MPRIRTRPARPVSRADLVVRALAAAGEQVDGVALAPVVDVTKAGLAEWTWHNAALTRDLSETAAASWPCEETLTDPDGAETLFRHGDLSGVYELPDGVVVLLEAGGGWFSVRAASTSRKLAHETVTRFRDLYPALYADQDGEGTLTVPITFWVLSQFGPSRRLRRVETVAWADVVDNYTAPVEDAIWDLVRDFEPGESGQLLLWHGPPGTGKTWALRALAHEWRGWAEFHCITDPDAFFVKDAAYMVDVLLADSYDAIDPQDGSEVTVEAGEKWRVLVLEDTGELLSADAKDRSGQGLSRLLNVVDGMIGQGLRILVLVTTNEAIGSLHPAVTRNGRCASEILFAPLTADEATNWLGREVDEPMTLADLYAAETQESITQALREFGGEDDPLDPLTRAAVDAASAPMPDLEDELAAASVPPAPSPETREEMTARAIESLVASDPLSRLVASHQKTLTTVEALIRSQGSAETAERDKDVADSALDALKRMAERDLPAPVVNVTLPEQQAPVVNVAAQEPAPAPVVNVTVPEQPAPVVNVAAPEAPHVDVHVAAAEAPVVTVNVPEPPKQEPPTIHVHPAPAPTARSLRISENPVTGVRTVTFDDEDGE